MRITRTIKTKVRGTTFRSVGFDRIQPGDDLDLRREPGNPADPNAIQVLHQGRHIGYIGRDLAASMAPALDSGAIATGTVDAVTGGTGAATNNGINIAVTMADDLNADDFNPPWAV